MRPLFFTLLWPTLLCAIWVGNPGQPGLLTHGVAWDKTRNWSVRLGYLSDYVYNQRFRDEKMFDDLLDEPTYVRLSTDSALITLNFKRKIDLYALLGSSQLQVDHEVYSSRQFSWGVGGKAVIFRSHQFRIGIDAKYFSSAQSPQFFLDDGQAYNITSPFDFDYSEIQLALGLSYSTRFLSPYVQATYLYAKIDPDPSFAIVRLPTAPILIDVDSNSVLGRKRWGLALGMTLLARETISLSLEARLLNQNGVDVSGELRF
jgi:hypothetical protein